MAIRIVTDTCSDLPPDVAEAHGITLVPLYVNIGVESFRAGVDIGADRFYCVLEQSPVLPTTSQPSVLDFLTTYERLLRDGHDVVCISVSGKLSGTLNSAVQAKAELGNPSRIAVVDSRLAGGSQGLLVLDTAIWAGEMHSVSGVVKKVEASIAKYHGFVVVDTLKYLQKGGRIGLAQAYVGRALQLKPIISIRNGETYPVERPRTRAAALERLIALTRELAPLDRVHVSYTTGRELAMTVVDRLADMVKPDNLVESRFGPVLGTHLGPNAVSVAVSQLDGSGLS